MQRPQFGLVHLLTSHVSFDLDFDFVRKRFKLYSWCLFFKILCFDKMFCIFHSCKIGMLSIFTRNISGSLGLYIDTYSTIVSSGFALTMRSRVLSSDIAYIPSFFD